MQYEYKILFHIQLIYELPMYFSANRVNLK